MNIGVLRVRLRLPENQSLKGKRRVVKSVIGQVRNKFNVSVAEIEDHELWQMAVIGIVCVSNDGRQANAVLSNVMNYVQSISGDAEIVDYEIELLNAL